MAIAYAEPVLPGDPLRVAIGLTLAAGDLILGEPDAYAEATAWLTGGHEDFEWLFQYISTSLLDRMARANGDLVVLGAEGVPGAAKALLDVAAFAMALEES
jgi:hypothetical protein